MARLTFDELRGLERQGWDSLCASEGDEFYGRLMTTDAVMILVNGAVLDREAVVASLGEAPPWDHFVMEDERLVPLGSDTATLVYRATARRDGEPPFEAWMASTYQLVDGQPRLALYQQTPLAP